MNVLLENRDDTCRFAPENVRIESTERTAPEPTPSSDNRHHHSLPHKLLGRRKQRLKALRTGFERPSSISENLQVQCLEFSDDPLSVLKLQRLDMKTARTCNNPDDHCGEYDATIAIEATAIGPLDVAIRRGDVNESLPVPFVLGSNFVGVVQQCGSKAKLDYGIEKGTRVTSIIRTGGNARFITLPLNALMVVPKRLDAAEVACIISLYLPCFQALHYGTPRPFRYSQSCLRDKRIFITGASLLEAQTLTWLARYAGAAQVFVSIAKEHFERIISYHAVPVDDDPIALFQTLDGLMMDVMIDYDFPKYLHVAQALLDDEKGRLVCCASPVKIATETEEVSPLCGWPSTLVDCWYSMDYFWEQSTLTLVNGATMFHYFDSWQSNPKGMQKDLSFLLGLLNSRHIRPHIDRFISLSGIPKAHRDLQKESVEGCIVCEPWKD